MVGSIPARGTNFNSRPCGRGDLPQEHTYEREYISIHAPAGGATEEKKESCILQDISIHAPAGGATDAGWAGWNCSAISIHAPAGGATHARADPAGHCDTFQFTPLREGRL